MPAAYNGQPGSILGSLPAKINISSSTSVTGSPIVLQTASPHGMTSGDYVDVQGHNTNIFANGRWPISVVDTTHVLLVGSLGFTGDAGGATGTVCSLGIGPTFAVPSSGDNRNAASVGPGLKNGAGDRSALLALQVGQYKQLKPQAQDVEDTTGQAQWLGFASFVTQGVWTQIHSFNNITGLEPGDILDVDLSLGGIVASSSNLLYLALWITTNNGSAGTTNAIPGSSKYVGTAGTTAATAISTTLTGRVTLTNSDESNYNVVLYGMTQSGSPGGVTVSFIGDYLLRHNIYRPTDFLGREGPA